MQNKPSKSKAECDIEGNTPYDCRDIESSPYSDPCETGRDDAETLRALQFALAPLPESERQILRCAPPFDAQAEHEADLRYESRVDYESWQYDGPEEQ